MQTPSLSVLPSIPAHARLTRRRRVIWLTVAAALPLCSTGRAADWLRPKEIELDRRNVAPELVEATRDTQFERGTPRPVLDGAGWVFGIPAKILLWDRRVENHAVTDDTEEALRRYLGDNGLDHVKVRINQYAPLDDWRRLQANTTVGWGYRYTLGALSVAGEAILPGRLLGGDHYNPFTGTIHLYSDVPAIALHEGGHAKDFTRRTLPGTYALVTALPFGSLWPEAVASGDAIAYAQRLQDPDLEREGYRILYPAYGTYLGGAFGDVLTAAVALPVQAGALVAGHATGRLRARAVPDAADPVDPADPADADGATAVVVTDASPDTVPAGHVADWTARRGGGNAEGADRDPLTGFAGADGGSERPRGLRVASAPESSDDASTWVPRRAR